MKLLFPLALLLHFISLPETHEGLPPTLIVQEQPKSSAFAVLRTKCNVCHATKKRTDIFTMNNMDSLAPDIWRQVFVKKKMPKGRKIKLTEEDTQALHDWLDVTLAK